MTPVASPSIPAAQTLGVAVGFEIQAAPRLIRAGRERTSRGEATFFASPHDRSIVQVEDRKTSERKFAEFAEFLKEFVTELNRLGAEGCVVLVEGARDVRAMRDVGYRGGIVSIAAAKVSESRLANSKTVVIMTDLDREGRRLAARYAKTLTHRGLAVSLDQRRRLLAASRGVFRHIENLKRFSYLVADVEI